MPLDVRLQSNRPGGTVEKKLIVYTYYIYTITMGLFDFFDYTPKSFFKKVEENLIPMDPKEILNMKATKVNEKFDEKYKDNEDYKQLPEEQRNAIFLLRVLKKGLSQDDKNRALSLCAKNEMAALTAIAIAEQPKDPYSKYDMNNKRSKTPSIKPGPSLEQRERTKSVKQAPTAAAAAPAPAAPAPPAPAPAAPAAAANNNDNDNAPEQLQEGGRKHTHRKTRHGRNKKRKPGLKKTQRHHHHPHALH